MNKDGVAALVATVILVGVVLVLGALFVAFGTDILENAKEYSDSNREVLNCANTRMQIDSVCQDGDLLKYKLFNSGQEDILQIFLVANSDSVNVNVGLNSFDRKEFLTILGENVGNLSKVEFIPVIGSGTACEPIEYNQIASCSGSLMKTKTMNTDEMLNLQQDLFDKAKERENLVNITNLVSCNKALEIAEKYNLPKVSKDYSLLFDPFKLDCENNNFAFSVSEQFEDIKVMRCSDGSCYEEVVSNIENVECALPLEIRSEITVSRGSFEKFEGKLDPPVGTNFLSDLLVVKGDVVELKAPADNEEFVVQGFYAYVDDEWKLIETKKEGEVLVANLDLRKFGTNNIIVGVGGLFCPGCLRDRLQKVYTPNPDTREAIVIVHGLFSSGNPVRKIVEDFRVTNQPYQLWLYNYPTGRDVNITADIFASQLEAVHPQFDDVHVIGMSLGGLVVREALDRAYYRDNLNFTKKVRQVILMASPNQGSPVAEQVRGLIDTSVGNDLDGRYFTLHPQINQGLRNGSDAKVIPNVVYYAIAGTETFDFSGLKPTNPYFNGETNDGLISLSSATDLGDVQLRNECRNLWRLKEDHWSIFSNRDVHKLVERIITRYTKEFSDDAVVGYSNNYLVNSCNRDDVYFVFGKERKINVYSEIECGCGNAVCDGLETSKTCSNDCKKEDKKIFSWLIILLVVILFLFILGFLLFRRKENSLN